MYVTCECGILYQHDLGLHSVGLKSFKISGLPGLYGRKCVRLTEFLVLSTLVLL